MTRRARKGFGSDPIHPKREPRYDVSCRRLRNLLMRAKLLDHYTRKFPL